MGDTMKKIGIVIIICFITCFICGKTVHAEEADTSSLDSIDLHEIENSLESLLGDETFNFKEAILSLIKGEIPLTMESVGEIIWDSLFAGFTEQKNTIVRILVIVIVAALFNNFSNIFESGQVSEISFYVVYLLLFAVLIQSFMSLTTLVTQTLNGIISFMKLLLPVYMIMVAIASGQVSAAVFYEITLIIILVVQGVLVYFIVPAINIFLVLSIVNHLSKEPFLTKMAKLVKDIIQWTLKTITGAVIGINVIQGLIAPMVDTVKANVINKTISAIPGIGSAFNSVTEIILGSAVLIKNCIGVAGMIVILLICGAPVVRLCVTSFMYKLLSAAVQPIADKRVGNCIDDVGTAVWLLLRVLITGVVLFLITLALIASGTNRGY